MSYLSGRILNYRFSVETYLYDYCIYLHDSVLYLFVSTCTTRDPLVFAISSVASYCELDPWTWSVIKSVWIYQVEFESLIIWHRATPACSCLRFAE